MIEKLVYIASQYPGEAILGEIINKFDDGKTPLNRWVWDIQITNIILLLHQLERHLPDEADRADLAGLIHRELMQAGDGSQVRVGDYLVDEEELRYLSTRGLGPDDQTDTHSLARLILGLRLPKMAHALEESLRNQALDSLPPDYGQMTYLVLELLRQIKGEEPDYTDNVALVAALEGVLEDYYRHLDSQFKEYAASTA